MKANDPFPYLFFLIKIKRVEKRSIEQRKEKKITFCHIFLKYFAD